MAVAPEALEAVEGAGTAKAAQAAARAPRRSSSSGGDWLNTGRSLYGRVSSPSSAAQTVAKLIWAGVLGFGMLALAAEATGQTWSFSLPNPGAQKPTKGAYVPLYAGQTSPASAALPGVFSGPVSGQSSDTNLSGRAGGNLAMP